MTVNANNRNGEIIIRYNFGMLMEIPHNNRALFSFFNVNGLRFLPNSGYDGSETIQHYYGNFVRSCVLARTNTMINPLNFQAQNLDSDKCG